MRLPTLCLCCVVGAAACGCAAALAAAPVPATKPSEPAVCNLTPEQLAARRKELIPGLFKRAREVSDIPNGLRFRFDHAPGLLSDLAKVMEREQNCCSFLRFQLSAEPSAGAVTFDVTGPAGTGEMLRKL